MHGVLRAKAAEAGFDEAEGSLLVLPYDAQEIGRISEALKTWSEGVGRKFCSSGASFPSSSSAGASSTSASSTGASAAEVGVRGDDEEGKGDAQVIDTIVLILTLCSIPNPHETLRALVGSVLVSGGEGQLLFYEHVRNPREDVAWWQDVVAPVWRHAFDGCVVGLDGVGVVRGAIEGTGEGTGEGERGDKGGWKKMETWGVDGEDVENLFWHQVGRCVKP